MEILTFAMGPYATNMYIIFCRKTKEAVIIDPGVGAFQVVTEKLKDHLVKPVAIWLTHSHWDHIVDAEKIKKNLSLSIYVHPNDKGNLMVPGSDGIPIIVPLFEGVMADHFIKEGDRLLVGEVVFKVMHTPGHSPGGVCFYSDEEKILFSGDTLFKGAIGTLKLPTAEPQKMKESLMKLFNLPEDTVVFPGHGKRTTIKAEKPTH